jgi:hypothetical protein
MIYFWLKENKSLYLNIKLKISYEEKEDSFHV